MRILICLLATCFLTLEARNSSLMDPCSLAEQLHTRCPQAFAKKHWKQIYAALQDKQLCVRIASYNLLFNITDNQLDYENRWPQRLPRIITLLEELDADIVATQELYADQVADLLAIIGNTYTFIGRGEEDKQKQGQVNGLLIRKDRFVIANSAFEYMSSTPDKPSRDPYGQARLLTTVHLIDKLTDKQLLISNCHLPFKDPNRRLYAAEWMAERLLSDMPTFLCGDFNTFACLPDLDMPAYDGSFLERTLAEHGYLDARQLSLLGHQGPLSTYTNSSQKQGGFQGLGTPGIFLDHIFCRGDLTILLHLICPTQINGHFPSDHMPVVVDVLL